MWPQIWVTTIGEKEEERNRKREREKERERGGVFERSPWLVVDYNLNSAQGELSYHVG